MKKPEQRVVKAAIRLCKNGDELPCYEADCACEACNQIRLDITVLQKAVAALSKSRGRR